MQRTISGNNGDTAVAELGVSEGLTSSWPQDKRTVISHSNIRYNLLQDSLSFDELLVLRRLGVLKFLDKSRRALSISSQLVLH